MVTELAIDLDAIAANWRDLRARHGGPTAAVVKADAYGLGAAAVAPRLHAAGCRQFCVAHPAEGAPLRPLLPDSEIIVFNGLWPGEAGFYVQHRLLPALGSLAEIAAWQAEAAREGRRLPAVLHVDTGMNRLGLDPGEVARLATEPERLDGIALRYVMTHLVSAECPEERLNNVQLDRFAAACARLPPAPRSIANSSGLFLGPGFRSNLARPGAALYGVNPTPGRPHPLRVPLRLRAQVLRVREVGAGESVGYNATWVARRPSRIATISVGYADGYHRALSGNGLACFDGEPVPLVGRVSMDLTTFDVTEQPAIGVGDWLELLGPAMPPDRVAARAGTNGYEILTALGRRYHRVYRPL